MPDTLVYVLIGIGAIILLISIFLTFTKRNFIDKEIEEVSRGLLRGRVPEDKIKDIQKVIFTTHNYSKNHKTDKFLSKEEIKTYISSQISTIKLERKEELIDIIVIILDEVDSLMKSTNNR